MIKELRIKKGMTQQQLAEKMGVQERHVRRIEAGEAKIGGLRFVNVIAMAEALETNLDEFKMQVKKEKNDDILTVDSDK